MNKIDKNEPIYFPANENLEGQLELEQESLFTIPQGDTRKVILLALDMGKYDAERSMQELAALAEANDMEPVAEIIQKKDKPEPATMLGTGRLAEAQLVGENLEAKVAIFDGELTGSQIRNLEEMLKIAVYDRTMLILDIFARRATTSEGKTQTELAMLEYRLPRLAGLGTSLSRQGGGGGGGGGARRGTGESKLEYDRRYIRSRIALLKKRLQEMQAHRNETRRARNKSGIPVIALVGYTNVGKSSLVNAICNSDITAANMLFATLDPSARSTELPDGQQAVLIDTVGFVSRLPHNLVEAFKSTLEEAKYADLLLKVCDASDPEANDQLEVTQEVLQSLGCDHIPQLVVYNKCDAAPGILPLDSNAILVSAQTKKGIPNLLNHICNLLSARVQKIEILLPYSQLSLVDTLHNYGAIQKEEYREDGVYYKATIQNSRAHLFQPFLLS